MLRNRDIIIFGDDWGRHPSTIQHVGRVLARYNRILWIGSLAHRKPRLNILDLRRFVEKGARMLLLRRQGERARGSENVFHLAPPVLPFHDLKFIRGWNTRTLVRSLRTAMQVHKFSRPVLITATPWVNGLIGKLGETSSHYLCLDDYSRFDRAYRALPEAERDLVSRVSACFFTSDLLRDKFSGRTVHSYTIPQGVDVGHFRSEESAAFRRVATPQKPVIGFVGLLADWVDLPLMLSAARAYPDAEFLVVGKATVHTRLLNLQPNIRYLGEMPYEDLPGMLRRMQVGLIPFLVNDLTEAANPLKLLEYFAIGIPVVSTNLPEVAKFKPLVYVAGDENEFIRLIGTALGEDPSLYRDLRIRKAEEYSWQNVTENISSVIEEIENRPPEGAMTR